MDSLVQSSLPLYGGLLSGAIVVALYILSSVSEAFRSRIRTALLFVFQMLDCVCSLSGTQCTYFTNSCVFLAAPLRDINAILETASSSTDPAAVERSLMSLRELTRTSADRECFYALSFPGFHPRCWKNLLLVVVQYVDKVKAQVEAATSHSRTIQQQRRMAKLTNLSANISRLNASKAYNQSNNVTAYGDNNQSLLLNDSQEEDLLNRTAPPKMSSSTLNPINSLFGEKQCFFLPPSLNPRSYEYFGQAKPEGSSIFMLPMSIIPLPVLKVLSQLRSWIFKPKPVISLFDARCAIFCIEAISTIVVNSTNEDRYGIVQKDLRTVISMLAGLAASIDAYVRVNKMGASDRDDENVFAVDRTLATCLQKIHTTFKPYIKDLQLPAKELEIMETLNH